MSRASCFSESGRVVCAETALAANKIESTKNFGNFGMRDCFMGNVTTQDEGEFLTMLPTDSQEQIGKATALASFVRNDGLARTRINRRGRGAGSGGRGEQRGGREAKFGSDPCRGKRREW